MSDREFELCVSADEFPKLKEGSQTFVCVPDEGFCKSDTLVIKEWDPGIGFSGRYIRRTVGCLRRSLGNLSLDGWVVLSLLGSPPVKLVSLVPLHPLRSRSIQVLPRVEPQCG